jgi:glycosyltransferase involved in cell wall biosynthesis
MVPPIKLIHIVDFENKNSWFEQYLLLLTKYQIVSEVVAIKKNTYLRIFCEENGIHFRGPAHFYFHTVFSYDRKGQSGFLLSHGYKPSLYALLMSKILGTKFVVIHHHQPHFFNLLRSRKPFKASIHSRIAKVSYQASFAIQSFSSEVSEALLESGVSQTKIFFNPIGMDLEPLQECASNSSQEFISKHLDLNVVSVCRLSWEKNLGLAIESIILAHQMDNRIQYFIYGDGPEKESLAQLIKARGADKFIHLKGFEKLILPKMKDADLFLHTSLTESYGQVIFEVFFLGTPILSSRVGVSIDLAKIDGKRVQLISGTSPEALSMQITGMLKQEQKRRPFNQAETSLLEAHSLTASVSNLVTFLTESLEHSSKKSK